MPEMQKQDVVINKIIKLAQSKFPESEIYLYGSRARRDNKKDSDWDLLVLLDIEELPFHLEKRIINDFYELEVNLGEAFSPLVYKKSDWEEKYIHTPLFDNISREGIQIK